MQELDITFTIPSNEARSIRRVGAAMAFMGKRSELRLVKKTMVGLKFLREILGKGTPVTQESC